MERRRTGRSRRKLHRWEIKLRNIAIPALLTAVSMMVILIALDYFHFDLAYGVGTTAIIFASFASSAFILFMTPRARGARIPRFVKSYIIGGVVGLAGSLMLAYVPLYITAAAVIFVVSALLYLTDSQHAPAVAIAFAFVIFHIDIFGLVIVIAGALLLIALRFVLEKFVFIIEELEKGIPEGAAGGRPRVRVGGSKRKYIND